MRIVSQNGMYDLPYEETTFQGFYNGKIAKVENQTGGD